MSDRLLSVQPHSKKTTHIKLLDVSQRQYFDKIIISLGGTTIGNKNNSEWLLSNNKLDLFYEAIEPKKKNGSDSPISSENSDKEISDGDESDDELIQQVLARRLMSESSRKSIEDESVENSDMEDCVSFCRRLRHIYSILHKLDERLKKLES